MENNSSQIPLIRTKLHRPPLSVVHVQRQQLLDQLNEQLIRPLTLVSAPAGYGKSTLLSSWLEACELPTAWLSVDEADNDLHLFLSYFLAAVQTAFPQACQEIQLILSAKDFPSLPVLAGHLINELDKIDQDFILVIDDFHLIQNRSIHELLEELLKHPPRPLHLVLASRVDPPLSLATLRARGQMTEIRMRDLRFSQEESLEFLQQMLETKIEESLAATLEEKTEGWVTGLHLAALSLRHREDLRSAITDLPANNRFVVDYFIAEILLAQPPAMLECLLRTSILGRFCAPLCDALCHSDGASSDGRISGEEFLGLLKKANLFVIPLDDEQRWFRYHHLFRDLLQRRLEQRFTPEEIEQLHTRASAWFSENNFVEEALQHAIRSGDMGSASRLVGLHRHDIMNSEQWHRLDRWLSLLPPAAVENTPEIVILRAWLCETWMRLDDLRTYLKQVGKYYSTKPSNDAPQWKSLRAEYHTLSALLFYLDGDTERVIELSRKALKRLAPEAQSPRSYAQCLLSFGYQMKGDLNGAREVLYDAIKESPSAQTTYQFRLYLSLAMVNWLAADLNGMYQVADQALTLFRDSKLPESVGIAHHQVGIFHYLQNDLNKADKHSEIVLQDFYAPNLLNLAHNAFALSLSYEAQGRSDEATDLAEKTVKKALGSKSSEFLHLAEAFQAELFLRQGQAASAQIWASNYNPHPFDAGYRFYVPQFTYVKVLMAGKTPEGLQRAIELLSELHDHYSAIHNSRFLIDVFSLQALLLDETSEESNAIEKLVEALNLAEPGGFVRTFLDLGQPMANLLNRFSRQRPDQVYAKQILAAFSTEKTITVPEISSNQSAGHVDVSNQALPEPLTGREIQILSVLSRGLGNQAIADSLFISPETVKRHLYNIFQKFDVKNRQQAIARARSLGLM